VLARPTPHGNTGILESWNGGLNIPLFQSSGWFLSYGRLQIGYRFAEIRKNSELGDRLPSARLLEAGSSERRRKRKKSEE